jgi:hypothetical protein
MECEQLAARYAHVVPAKGAMEALVLLRGAAGK